MPDTATVCPTGHEERGLTRHSTVRRSSLSPIHTFRGFAIVLVVAYHCMTMFAWNGSSLMRDILDDTVANGTILFVFISGYLFQHLSGDFRYLKYLKSKLKHVVIPYVIVAFPAVFYTAILHDPVTDYPNLAGSSTLGEIFWFYLTGATQINYPLWFIPVICVFFLLSPLFFAIIRRPALYGVLGVLVPVAVLAHRPNFPNPDLVHSVVYFLPAYVLGMFASQSRASVNAWLDRHLVGLCVGFIIFFVVHLLVSSHHGNYIVPEIFSFKKGYVDWALLQKLGFAFVLLGVLNRYDSWVARPMRPCGDHAFSIYFLHAYVMYGFHVVTRWHVFKGGALTLMVVMGLVLAVSLAVTTMVQRLLGDYSRMFIGS
jgi:peptidoglycan/LPS O-acetylase OafA/YrhL